MGGSFSTKQFPKVPSARHKYTNDKSWERLASEGRHIGLSVWNMNVARLVPLHSRLFMGSRLSAQQVIDGAHFKDQFGVTYEAKMFDIVCVASGRTCDFCEISEQYKQFHMFDRHGASSEDFINTSIQSARYIQTRLAKGRHVLVHCHSGRNRSALSILVYAAIYTTLSFEESVNLIRASNASRFPHRSTLQNRQFLIAVKENWEWLRKPHS